MVFALADSHVAMPVDDRPLDAILHDDVAPYDWLGMSLAAVMPAHVIYPQVDTKPAGFSRVWLQDILRGKLGFTGAIFSDDLSMEAARQGGTLAEAATAALEAGCDRVLICNQPDEAGKGLDTLRFKPSRASRQRMKRLRPRGTRAEVAQARGSAGLSAGPGALCATHSPERSECKSRREVCGGLRVFCIPPPAASGAGH